MQIAEKWVQPIWASYYECCKPKVVYLIVFTALVGMLLSTDTLVPLDKLFGGLIGIGLAAAAGAALNHAIDAELDQRMERTRRRPVAQGTLKSSQVVVFALILASLATLILVTLVNTLTALLTLASMVGYAIIYTVFLKRMTPQNVVIGGAAGAAPPVLGWAAITGDISASALVLFLIIFVWTPPHFWALAIKRRQEYAKAAIPVLPVTHGIEFTKLHILLYSVLLFIVSLLPFLIYMSGPVYLVGALALSSGFVYHAWVLYQTAGDQYAMKTFSYSIFYLTALFAFLLSDHYVGLFIHQTLGG